VKPGEVFATFHRAEVFLNRVTGPGRDRYVSAPEYKVTAMRVEKASRPDGAPAGVATSSKQAFSSSAPR
jgi:formate dehydrogenase major subunit